jgi:hypothetical protein
MRFSPAQIANRWPPVVALAAPALGAILMFAAPARADALLDRLRLDAARADIVGFERTTREEKQTAKGPVTEVRIDRFDPRARKGQQWTLVSVDGREPSMRQRSEHRKLVSSFPVPGFYRLSAILAGEPTRSVDAEGRVRYRWTSLPAGSMPTPGPDISTRMAAEALVETVAGKPVFRSVRLFAPRPFQVMSVAKVNRFDQVNVYDHDGSGQPVLISQASETDISAPFGQGVQQKSRVSFRPLS